MFQVVLLEDFVIFDEVVVVGYGIQKKRNVIVVIVFFDEEVIKFIFVFSGV